MEVIHKVFTSVEVLSGLGLVRWLIFPYVLFGMAYIFFVALVKIADVWSELHLIMKILIAPFAIMGALLDVIVNATIGTVLFLELPKWRSREWLFTARLKRWKMYTSWRGKVATWLCEEGLNPIQPDHC